MVIDCVKNVMNVWTGENRRRKRISVVTSWVSLDECLLSGNDLVLRVTSNPESKLVFIYFLLRALQ